MKLESCWKRNSIESLKKTEGTLLGKVIEMLDECFESWQAIPSQYIRKPEENLKKTIDNQLKFQQDRGEGLGFRKCLMNALKVGRQFPHNTLENLKKT